LYPGLMVTLIVIVYNSPLLPKNNFLLVQIIGYKKYMGRDDYQINEKDLPWTIGLDVHTDIIDNSFHYGGNEIPEWMQGSEDDVGSLMKILHQTIYQHVSEAINGKMKSSRTGRGISIGKSCI